MTTGSATLSPPLPEAAEAAKTYRSNQPARYGSAGYLTASSIDPSLSMNSIIRGCFKRIAIRLFNSAFSGSPASPFDFAPVSDFSLTHQARSPGMGPSARSKSFSYRTDFLSIMFSFLSAPFELSIFWLSIFCRICLRRRPVAVRVSLRCQFKVSLRLSFAWEKLSGNDRRP